MTIWKGWTWARGDIDMLSLRKDHEYYREGDTSTQLNLAIGWRREHAHRVWSAMQAVLAVAALDQAHQSVADLAGDLDWDGCVMKPNELRYAEDDLSVVRLSFR